MDFIQKKPQITANEVHLQHLEGLYPHNVLLYKLPPQDVITLDEFNELALERLKLLRIFDLVNSKPLRYLSEEWVNFVKEKMVSEGLKNFMRLLEGRGSNKEAYLQARRQDYISHFILRLVYCKTEDLKRWFMEMEMSWFRMRFSYLTTAVATAEFIRANDLPYAPLNGHRKDELKGYLYASSNITNIVIEAVDFYEIPFTEALDAVKARRCYLKNGMAFVSSKDFISVVGSKMKDIIENGLKAAKEYNKNINDDRVNALTANLHTLYSGKSYTVETDEVVPIEALDELSKSSYPLCMQILHEELRKKHHLKYNGRQVYGLYLKGIGVQLQDALRFWREEFTKLMDGDKFEKQYAYNIRHNYGKEGSRKDYAPMSCINIMNLHATIQDCTGCPYKMWDSTMLRNKIISNGIPQHSAGEIVNLAAKGHYQLACGKYFDITHQSMGNAIMHPNQYFEISQIQLGGKVKKNTSSWKRAPRSINKSEDMKWDDDTEFNDSLSVINS